jgi:hypothetical protein
MTINNILIIEDLYLKQIEVNLNDFVYNKYLRLITNDLKIYKRIKETIRLRNYVSRISFNKF